jgi:hypothetical protein
MVMIKIFVEDGTKDSGYGARDVGYGDVNGGGDDNGRDDDGGSSNGDCVIMIWVMVVMVV